MWASLYIIVCVRSASRGVYNLLGETIEIDATSPRCASIWVIVIEQGCEHATLLLHDWSSGTTCLTAIRQSVLQIQEFCILFTEMCCLHKTKIHVDEKLTHSREQPSFSVFCYSLSSPLSYVASYWHAAPSHHFYIHPGTWWFQSGSKTAVIVRMKLRSTSFNYICFLFRAFSLYIYVSNYPVRPREFSRVYIYIQLPRACARAPLLLLRMVRGYSDVLR